MKITAEMAVNIDLI